mgnify:CR=1 FL=1
MDLTHMRRETDFSMFENVDVVFHLACLARVQPSIENPSLYHDKNVNGLVNVLEACRIHKVKRLVFSSSSSVYGDVEEKDLPTSERSIFFNNRSYTDKVYNKAIDDMIKDKDR